MVVRLSLFGLALVGASTHRSSRAATPASTATTTAARIDALEQELRALEGLVLSMSSDGDRAGPELRVYGFFETGLQRTWSKEGGLLRGAQPTPGWTFTLGSLNLYLDVIPSAHWRALVEARITTNHGALGAGEFSGLTLLNTYQRSVSEPGLGLGAAQITSALVLERAQIEYELSDLLGVRVGLWLTPWGIWNVDHGAPTLIPLISPYFVSFQVFPAQQLGLAAYGRIRWQRWLLEYHLGFSNGRLNGPGTLRATWPSFDLTDDKMLSGRLVLARPSLGNFRLGLSGHWGKSAEDARQIAGIDPVRLKQETGIVLEEWGVGADLSWDPAFLRIRAEYIYGRFHFPGERPASSLYPNAFEADSVVTGGYLLVSLPLRLSSLDVEPYIYSELDWAPTSIAPMKLFGMTSGGVNLSFTPSVLLKTQYGWQYFFQSSEGGGLTYVSNERVLLFSTRLVVSF